MKFASEGVLAVSGALGLGILGRFLGYPAEPPPQTEFDLGPATQYPLGAHTNIPDVPAVIDHAKDGFTALSLVCTHLGCTLDQNKDGFTCPCHGSHFDSEGNVLRGPAAKHLESLKIKQDQTGHLILLKDE